MTPAPAGDVPQASADGHPSRSWAEPRVLASMSVLVGGVLLAVVLAVDDAMSAHDVVVLLGAAAGGALAAAGLGALVLHALRRRSVGTQALAVALIALASTVAGVVVAARAMFISAHDVAALMVVVVMSASVAAGAALQLGRTIDRAARRVGAMARQLGQDGALDDREAPSAGSGDTSGADPAPSELGDLARQLAEARSRLAEARRHEQALDRSRRELIAWISHDLRSPLATIRAVAEALDDEVVQDEATVARYHHQLRQDAERLSALVDDLFELSRINSGAVGHDRQVVGLPELVAQVVAEARPGAALKGVELVDHLAERSTVAVSSQELRRALHNLIDNAVRHTPPGGRVLVEIVPDEQGARLLVSDECGGIPESDLTRVFDIAFRGDQARAKDEGGGGLGLAIAKGLVEAHEGSIEVANQAQGCRFTVRLPVEDPGGTGLATGGEAVASGVGHDRDGD